MKGIYIQLIVLTLALHFGATCPVSAEGPAKGSRLTAKATVIRLLRKTKVMAGDKVALALHHIKYEPGLIIQAVYHHGSPLESFNSQIVPATLRVSIVMKKSGVVLLRLLKLPSALMRLKSQIDKTTGTVKQSLGQKNLSDHLQLKKSAAAIEKNLLSRAALLASKPIKVEKLKLILSKKYPIEGAPTTIKILGVSAPYFQYLLKIIYRPNSTTAEQQMVFPADNSRRFIWKPRTAGIAQIILMKLPETSSKVLRLLSALSQEIKARPTLPVAMQSEVIKLFGLVTKSAKKVLSRNVAIAYAGTPFSGILIMLLAGFILFGGLGWSLYRYFRNRVISG